MTEPVTLTPEVADLFRQLLGQVQLPALAPDLEQQAAVIVEARKQLGL